MSKQILRSTSQATSQITLGYLNTILGVFFFGLTLPFTKEIVKEMDPVFLGWARPFFAGLIALVYIHFSKFTLPNLLHLRLYKKYGLVILGMAFGFPFFSSLSMGKISASHGGVLLSLLPICITLVGVFLSKERPSLPFWIAVLLGSGLVIVFSLEKGLGRFQIGDIYLFIAIILASFGYAWGSILSKNTEAKKVISWALILAIPINGLPTLFYFPKNFFDYSWPVYFYFFLCHPAQPMGGFFFLLSGSSPHWSCSQWYYSPAATIYHHLSSLFLFQ